VGITVDRDWPFRPIVTATCGLSWPISERDQIAVLDLNHPPCLELPLACAQVGTTNAVVNHGLAPPEVVYVINDAKARLLLFVPEFASAAAEYEARLSVAGQQRQTCFAYCASDQRVSIVGPASLVFIRTRLRPYNALILSSIPAGQDFESGDCRYCWCA